MRFFQVPLVVVVKANTTRATAADEVFEFLGYGFEINNDSGCFRYHSAAFEHEVFRVAGYRVPAMLAVEAETKEEAFEQVCSMLRYLFDVSNDEGRFKRWEVAGLDDIEEVEPLPAREAA